MGILQQASGTFSGGSPFTVALPGASSASSRVVLFVAGNTIISTPSGWTLRASQVNYMGHYLFDVAGGGTSYTVTPGASSASAGMWYLAEVASGVFDRTVGDNQAGGDGSITSPIFTPTAGVRTLFASVGSLDDGTASATVDSWTGGYVEQTDLSVALADRPMGAVATLDLTATGSTAYGTVATFSKTRIGRSVIMGSYVTSNNAVTPVATTTGATALAVGFTGASSPIARSTAAAVLGVGFGGIAKTVAIQNRPLALGVGFTGAASTVASTFGVLPMGLGATGTTSITPVTTGTLPVNLGLASGSPVPVFARTGALTLGLGLASSVQAFLGSVGSAGLAFTINGSAAPTAISAGLLPLAFTMSAAVSPVARTTGQLPLTVGTTGQATQVENGATSGTIPLGVGFNSAVVPVARTTGTLPLSFTSTNPAVGTVASSTGSMGVWLNFNGNATSGETVSTTGTLPLVLPLGNAVRPSQVIAGVLSLTVPMVPTERVVLATTAELRLTITPTGTGTGVVAPSTTGVLPLLIGLISTHRVTPTTTGQLPLVLGADGGASSIQSTAGSLPLDLILASKLQIPLTGGGAVRRRDGKAYTVYTNVGGVLSVVAPKFRVTRPVRVTPSVIGRIMPTKLGLTGTARAIAKTTGSLPASVAFTGTGTPYTAPDPSAGPVAVSSFGPNGTHWPTRTPWKDAPLSTVIEVDATWTAIGAALDTLTAAQVHAGASIRIRPGTLPSTSNGGGAAATPVLQNKGSLEWQKRVLIYPRDGYGSVTVVNQVRYLSLYNVAIGGLKFTNTTGGGWLASDCTQSAFFWTRQAYYAVYSIDGRENTDVEVVEIVNPDAIYRDSDLGAFRTGSAAGSGQRRISMVGSYLAPCFMVAGSAGHTDTIQHSNQGGNFYGDYIMTDTMVGASTNCAVQIGSADGWDAEHVLIVGGNELVGRLWTRDATREGGSSHAATNGGGQNMVARNSTFIGGMGAATFTTVENSQISYNWGSGAGFTVNPALANMTRAEFDALAPKPDDARLAQIWA